MLYAWALWGQVERTETLNENLRPFFHGVASGDPLEDRVIIWTRITPEILYAPVPVAYEISLDTLFNPPLLSGQTNALPEKDFTVKVDVSGLSPTTHYYYRFKALSAYSPVGRTQTAGPRERMRIAVLSCSDYRKGYYNGLARLSARNDLDVVIHTGDYIYEGGGGPEDRRHAPDEEVWQLQHYRTRYAQYRTDYDLQRCHQLYPWVVIWDDHDVVVDAMRDTSLRHEARHGSYRDRKAAAVQAMREWLPLRDPENDPYKNWRSFRYGDFTEIFMIDARLYDRDTFVTSVNDPRFGAPDHKFLGPEQLSWLNTGLKNTPAQWKIVGNGLMISQFQLDGTPLIFENWDGYPHERNAFFDNLAQNAINNVAFVTGDFHCAFACDVSRDPFNAEIYNPATGAGSLCVEFIAPSLSSGNFDEGDNFGLNLPAPVLEQVITDVGKHTKYVNLTEHGYILIDATRERLQGEFWYCENIGDPYNETERLGAVYYAMDGENRLRPGTAASSGTAGPVAPSNPNPRPPKSVSRAAPALQVTSIGPNPAHDRVLVHVFSLVSRTTTIKMTTLDGRTVMEKSLALLPGMNECVVDWPPVSRGVYLMHVGGGVQKLAVE